MDGEERLLQSQLQAYCESGIYPMHMPGHKRALAPVPGLPYAYDVTEVPGTDDLHCAGGILRDAMDRASGLFGSRRTWFLVNGSTCGVLASVYACVPAGGELIAARNCHKSVFHAIELLNLRVHWLVPSFLPDWELCGSIPPAEVGRLLSEHPAAKTVIVTSPTYEGIVSDIAAIADVCHAAGARLIVDEAHGAHLGLFPGAEEDLRPGELSANSMGSSRPQDGDAADAARRTAGEEIFPDSALHLGADIVIQSAHKTLPSLTQTALLHLGHPSQKKYDSPAIGAPRGAADASGGFREPAAQDPMAAPDASDREEERLCRLEASIGHALDIFETSSPSYPLLASLDGCVGLLRSRGAELFAQWRRQIRLTEETCAGLSHLRLLRKSSGPEGGNLSWVGTAGNPDVEERRREAFFGQDGSKLLLRADSPDVTGAHLCALFEEAGIEPEMHCGRNVLLMSGCGDTEEGWEKLRRVLPQVDARLQDNAEGEAGAGCVLPAADAENSLAVSAPDADSGRRKTLYPSAERERAAQQARAGESLFCLEIPGMAWEPAAVHRAVLEGQTVTCPLREAVGGICAEYVCAYPPGIPILLPGERITPRAVRLIRELTRQGTRLVRSSWSRDGSILRTAAEQSGCGSRPGEELSLSILLEEVKILR